MSKLNCQIKSKVQILFLQILDFEIPLTFACLPVGREFEI